MMAFWRSLRKTCAHNIVSIMDTHNLIDKWTILVSRHKVMKKKGSTSQTNF